MSEFDKWVQLDPEEETIVSDKWIKSLCRKNFWAGVGCGIGCCVITIAFLNWLVP